MDRKELLTDNYSFSFPLSKKLPVGGGKRTSGLPLKVPNAFYKTLR